MKRLVLIALLACAACAAPPASDREVRLERLGADHRALMAQLEDLQARLLVGADRVRFWDEMRERHESISAIACTSQEAHAVAMAEHLEREQSTARKPSTPARQARVASARQASDTDVPARRR